jgi:hypothetical protein
VCSPPFFFPWVWQLIEKHIALEFGTNDGYPSLKDPSRKQWLGNCQMVRVEGIPDTAVQSTELSIGM